MTASFIRIYTVVLVLCVNSNLLLAMDVEDNSTEERMEQTLLSHVRNKISKIFGARERFIRQMINELMTIDNKQNFIDFMEDLSTIDSAYIDTHSPGGDISSLKQQHLNAMLSVIVEQTNLYKDIIEFIDKEISRRQVFLCLGPAFQNSGMDGNFLVSLYLYINDNLIETKNAVARNNRHLLKEKMRNKNVSLFKFEDTFNPILLCQQFMATIADELPTRVAHFLVNDPVINNANRCSIIVHNLLDNMRRIVANLNRFNPMHIEQNLFRELFLRHVSLALFKELCIDKELSFDNHLVAKGIVKLVESEALQEDVLLHLSKQKEKARTVSSISHSKKPGRKEKQYGQGKPALKSEPQQDIDVNQTIQGEQTVLGALNTTADKEKFETNNTTKAKTESKQDLLGCETKETLEVKDLDKDNTEEFPDYFHYNKIRKAQQKSPSSTTLSATTPTSSSTLTTTKLQKARFLADGFNNEQLRIYRGLLSGKDLHKTYCFNDLLKVVAGFHGKKIGDGDSHFTFDIADFGAVYLVRAHGSGRDNRWLSGTYVRIFMKRLEELGLISDALRAAYL